MLSQRFIISEKKVLNLRHNYIIQREMVDTNCLLEFCCRNSKVIFCVCTILLSNFWIQIPNDVWFIQVRRVKHVHIASVSGHIVCFTFTICQIVAEIRQFHECGGHLFVSWAWRGPMRIIFSPGQLRPLHTAHLLVFFSKLPCKLRSTIARSNFVQVWTENKKND